MNSKSNIIILAVWIALALISYVGFRFLSSRPDLMLAVEKHHSSNAYLLGRELLEQGKTTEAITVINRGIKFFDNLYQETKQRRHGLQYVQGLLELARIYGQFDDPVSLQNGLDLYSKATAFEPRYADGQPYLAQGMILRKLNRCKTAVEAYSDAIKYGGALVALEAIFERGYCYKQLGEYEKACEDWYYFVRFQKNISDTVWDELNSLPGDICPRQQYLLARIAEIKNQKPKALQYWKSYLENYPDDRSAAYYHNRLAQSPVIVNQSIIYTQELFPQKTEIPYTCYSMLLDFYETQSREYSLQMELSTEDIILVPLKFQLFLNDKLIDEHMMRSSDLQTYKVSIILNAGMNALRLKIDAGNDARQNIPIIIHSAKLLPLSDVK